MSDDQDRIKRPHPERVQPFRSWSTLLTGGASRNAGDAPRAQGSSAGADASARREPSGAPSLNDVVARSVDIGYRVIDEYMRQGQKAAQRFSDRSFGPDAVANDVREVTDRMAQHASDVLGLWFQFLEMVSANGALRTVTEAAAAARTSASTTAAPGAAPSAAPASNGTGGQPLDRARVRIEVASPYPAEVAIDLRPDVTAGPFIVHGLRATDAEKPRLTDVVLTVGVDGDAARLRVRVPQGQPAGNYSGLILDEATSRPVGTVTVRVSDE